MARKDKLEFVDEAVQSASLQENKKAISKGKKDKKIKTINILVDWENKIKEYYGGTVSGYITTAIQEKMERDGIL
jgi:hypothetical protein